MLTELYKIEGLTTMNIKTVWDIFNKSQDATFQKHLVLIQRVTLEMGLGMYVNLVVNINVCFILRALTKIGLLRR